MTQLWQQHTSSSLQSNFFWKLLSALISNLTRLIFFHHNKLCVGEITAAVWKYTCEGSLDQHSYFATFLWLFVDMWTHIKLLFVTIIFSLQWQLYRDLLAVCFWQQDIIWFLTILCSQPVTCGTAPIAAVASPVFSYPCPMEWLFANFHSLRKDVNYFMKGVTKSFRKYNMNLSGNPICHLWEFISLFGN